MRGIGTRPALRLQALVLALAAGAAAPPAIADDRPATVDSAAQLLEAGRVVEAKSILLTLKKTATNRDQDRVLELLAAADRRLRHLGEVELSLQKAELALKQGELRVAETHASAAKRSDKATPAQRSRAEAVVSEAKMLREQLSPMVGPTLAQAVSDFTRGHYAEAKAGFASILRTGAALTQEQMAEVNKYQDRIYELEREQGRSFEVEYVPLSVMQSAGKAVKAVAAATPAVASTEDAPEQASQDHPAQEQSQPGDDLLDETLKVDAERMIVEAEAAFQAGRYNEAIDKFTKAVSVYGPHLSDEQKGVANDRIAEARALIGGAGQDALGTVLEQKRIAREEAEAVFKNLIAQANAALGRGDTQAARNLAAQARLTWNNAQANGLFSEEQYRSGISQADALLRQIDDAAEAITVAEIEARQKDLKADEVKTRVQQEKERRQRINENLDRIRALQAEQKYDEALQVVDQVLFLDPLNPAALLLKDVLRDVRLYKEFEEIRRERAYSYEKEYNENDRALIAPADLMSYPADWPEISFRRGDLQSFVESEADRKVLATMETRRIPASFRDNSLEDVLAFVGTVTNLNMDIDWDSLAQIGIERDKEITLELREVPARVVLERILQKAQPDAFSKAGWAVNDGVLVVAADEALRKNTFVVIYDIRDLLFQIPDFPDAPQLDLDQVLNQGGQGGGGGGGSIFGGAQGENEPVGPTEEELMEKILEIIQTNVDFEGWRDNGGDTGVIQELGGNLIITNTAANHRQIQGVLNQLREIRSVQINVESRFLTVSSDFFEQIAFDLDVYLNADNEQFKAVNRQLDAFGIGSLANEGHSVYPSDIVGITDSSTFGYVFQNLDAAGNPQYAYQNQPYSVPVPSPLSVVPVTQNSAGLTEGLTLLAGNELASAAILGNPALGAAATLFLDDIQVDVLLEATQADRRNVSLSAPRLTFANGRAANIAVVNQIGFISDLQPVTGTGSASFDPTVGRLNSGVSLGVRGVASADRRYVTLTIQTSVSGSPRFRQQTLTATAGGTGQNTVPQVATGTIEIPTIDVTSINTGVTVPDKGTVMLGGQRLTTELEIETGVPVLSKLPILNRFFTNRSQVKEERTLMILVKPTIIIQNEEEEKAFPGLLDKLHDPFR